MSARFERANNEAINLGTGVDLPGTNNELFIDAWVRRASDFSSRIISKDVIPSVSGTFALGGSGPPGFARFVVNGTLLTGATGLGLGTWHHIAGDYDGTNMRIFINGVLDGTVAKTGFVPSNAQNTRIGSDGSSRTTNNMNGDIQRIRIFNRSFNIAQIQSMFEANAMDTVVDELFYEWKLTEGGDNVNIGASVIVNSGPQALANGSGEGDGGNLPTWMQEDLQIYQPVP